jgi:hypothetical protein
VNSKSDAGGGMGYFAKIHYFFDHGVRCVPAEKKGYGNEGYEERAKSVYDFKI